jgi:hypothetical protein
MEEFDNMAHTYHLYHPYLLVYQARKRSLGVLTLGAGRGCHGRYMEEFDNMAHMYIQQMTERHAHNLLEFQRQLQRVRPNLTSHGIRLCDKLTT